EPRGDQASEEAFDLFQPSADLGSKLPVMRRNLQRGIDQEAAAPRAIMQGTFDNFREEGMDCLLRRMCGLQALHARAYRAVEIALQRPDEERALVAETVVEAGTADAHRRSQVAHRTGAIAMVPEALDRGVERHAFVECDRSCHEVPGNAPPA